MERITNVGNCYGILKFSHYDCHRFILDLDWIVDLECVNICMNINMGTDFDETYITDSGIKKRKKSSSVRVLRLISDSVFLLIRETSFCQELNISASLNSRP